jgi:hypothetical protein
VSGAILKKVISGGQNGADIAGVIAAKKYGLLTGGTMPKDFRTLDGLMPYYAKLYGMVEDGSSSYRPRTIKNVFDADGTIRFATDFESSDEKLTWAAIVRYRRPWRDVYVGNPRLPWSPASISLIVNWIVDKRISTLNVAGNSEQTSPGIGKFVEAFMLELFVSLPKDPECIQ